MKCFMVDRTHITSADEPWDVSAGHYLSIDVTSQFRFTPSVIHMHHSYHVPLKKTHQNSHFSFSGKSQKDTIFLFTMNTSVMNLKC